MAEGGSAVVFVAWHEDPCRIYCMDCVYCRDIRSKVCIYPGQRACEGQVDLLAVGGEKPSEIKGGYLVL